MISLNWSIFLEKVKTGRKFHCSSGKSTQFMGRNFLITCKIIIIVVVVVVISFRHYISNL